MGAVCVGSGAASAPRHAQSTAHTCGGWPSLEASPEPRSEARTAMAPCSSAALAASGCASQMCPRAAAAACGEPLA